MFSKGFSLSANDFYVFNKTSSTSNFYIQQEMYIFKQFEICVMRFIFNNLRSAFSNVIRCSRLRS